MNACMNACMHVCVYIHVYTCIHTYTRTRLDVPSCSGVKADRARFMRIMTNLHRIAARDSYKFVLCIDNTHAARYASDRCINIMV